MIPHPYPLCWPEGVGRPRQTVRSQFRTSLSGAIGNIRDGMRMLLSEMGEKQSELIISSNASLGVDQPADPGVAVWFRMSGAWTCFACAKYLKPADNLQAIVHVVDARRTELRHVGIEMVRATFQGLKALPAPKHWSEVLGVPRDATRDQVKTAYRALAGKRHPDRGGSQELMAELNSARDAAERDIPNGETQ